MKLLIRIPPTPRGCGFPAHIYEYLHKLFYESLGNFPRDWNCGDYGKSLWENVKDFIEENDSYLI